MEEERSIFDTITKTCVACGQTKTIRNFPLDEKKKFAEGVNIADLVGNVCKCCEAKPAMQLKSNRIDLLRAKLAHFKANAAKREAKQREKEYQKELREMCPTRRSKEKAEKVNKS